MFRLLKLGLLAGAGYYAYKKISANQARSSGMGNDPWGDAQQSNNNGLLGQLTRTVNQAINSAKQGGSRFGMSSSSSGYDAGSGGTGATSGQPREAQSARMAAEPAPPPSGEFGAPITAPPASR